MNLQIAPHETYPSERSNNVPPVASMEMLDMPQMATFVYDFYMQRVEAMKIAFEVTCLSINYNSWLLCLCRLILLVLYSLLFAVKKSS